MKAFAGFVGTIGAGLLLTWVLLAVVGDPASWWWQVGAACLALGTLIGAVAGR